MSVSNREEEIEVTDNRNSKFYLFERESRMLGQKEKIYWSYVNGLDEEYAVFVNGEEIILMK